MGSRAIFFSGNRQEVNSTWYPEIEEPIKSREKHYSLVLYMLNAGIRWVFEFWPRANWGERKKKTWGRGEEEKETSIRRHKSADLQGHWDRGGEPASMLISWHLSRDVFWDRSSSGYLEWALSHFANGLSVFDII